jgi:hypothetical protein
VAEDEVEARATELVVVAAQWEEELDADLGLEAAR